MIDGRARHPSGIKQYEQRIEIGEDAILREECEKTLKDSMPKKPAVTASSCEVLRLLNEPGLRWAWAMSAPPADECPIRTPPPASATPHIDGNARLAKNCFSPRALAGLRSRAAPADVARRGAGSTHRDDQPRRDQPQRPVV